MYEESKVVEITCRDCGQKRKLIEKEIYDVEPADMGVGDCADDSRIYFYSFKVQEDDFEVVHNNPHFYDHTIQCKRCGCNKMSKKDL